ncbi:MAG: hypothetical protein HY013_10070 [Candidatus Solibacter usitatus]|nr:hypothetical protein [Candidatus Solibacter usitatus]
MTVSLRRYGLWLLPPLALLAACILWTTLRAQQQPAVITLNPSIRYQTITGGWETTDFAAQGDKGENPAFPLFKDALFDQAVNDLGLNRVRLEIRASTENTRAYWDEFRRGTLDAATWRCVRYSTVNDNNDPMVLNPSGFHFEEMDFKVDQIVLPLKQRVEARGGKLWVNVCYVAFTSQMQGAGCPAGLSNHLGGTPDEYAEFVLAAYRHLESKYGFAPDSWEVILEPDNTPEWRGTQIGRAIAAAGRRLQAAGFVPRFVAPSDTSMTNAWMYFDDMIQVPGVQPYVFEIAYHRYAGSSLDALGRIRDRSVNYGVGAAMLEHIGSGYDDLHQDLTLGRNTSWSQFTLAAMGLSGDDGGAYYRIDDSNPQSPRVVPGARTRFLRQYFRFIRPGAVRMEATTSNSSFDPVAFVNRDGKQVVVVKASQGGSFSIAGLPAGAYGLKYTTAAQSDVDQPDVVVQAGQALSASIPAAGVLTVYGKDAAGQVPTVAVLVNAASQAAGAVAPGELVTLYGGGLGPATPVEMQLGAGGLVASSLAGTSVLFDGVPAPMLYVRDGQINAVVPYAVAGRTSTRMQVSRMGQLSAALSLPVADASPALFTLDNSGRGPGAILNQDGSINSDQNQATNGSVVVLYATGEGQTQPTGIDGWIDPGAARRPNLIVSARVGGIPAEVVYAGNAPFLVAGVMQVNINLPPSAPTGQAIPVDLTVGGFTSPAGVTLAIR